MIILERTTSDSSQFKILTDKLDHELKLIYGSSQDEFDQYNIMSQLDTVVIAYINETPVGCGCFKKFDTATAELKRMFVGAPYRGQGIGTAVLTELENWAKEIRYSFIVLETGTVQPDAINLYQKHGYHIIPNFDPYIGNELSICFKKSLE